MDSLGIFGILRCQVSVCYRRVLGLDCYHHPDTRYSADTTISLREQINSDDILVFLPQEFRIIQSNNNQQMGEKNNPCTVLCTNLVLNNIQTIH